MARVFSALGWHAGPKLGKHTTGKGCLYIKSSPKSCPEAVQKEVGQWLTTVARMNGLSAWRLYPRKTRAHLPD